MLPPRASPFRASDTGTRVPSGGGVAERAIRARRSTDGTACGAGRVLGLRTDQLAAHAAVHARVARALLGGRARRARGALARVLVRRRSRCRGAGGRAPRGAVSGRARLVVRGMAGGRGGGAGGALALLPAGAPS